jgi:hypothetical protein
MIRDVSRLPRAKTLKYRLVRCVCWSLKSPFYFEPLLILAGQAVAGLSALVIAEID